MTAVSMLNQRNQSLDVLRCVAVLLVLGFHFPYYALWSRIGWIGVDLFFVLSGFLISGLLFREYQQSGKLGVKRFLIRRGLKIYPSYYLLIMTSVVVSFAIHSPRLREYALVSAIFGQNYYQGLRYTMLSHTWSIAIEEHFYVFLPLLLVALIKMRRSRDPFNWLPAFFIVLVVMCLFFRWKASQLAGIFQMTHMRIDSLFAGVTLGYLHHFRPLLFQKFTSNYALAAGILSCIPAGFLDQDNRALQTIGLTGLLLGFSFIVAWSVVRTPRTSVGRAVCVIAARIGFYSYSIYLWHTVVGEALFHSGVSFVKFWSYVTTCVVVGIGMSHLLEIPYLRLRDRMFPTRTRALTS
jgi:peptidoglycan/LPS O-acetylase OafA/YrhL